VDAIFTPEQLAEVKAYHAPRYVYAAIDAIVWPVVLAIIVRFGTRPLYAIAARLAAALAARLLLVAAQIAPVWRHDAPRRVGGQAGEISRAATVHQVT
jgi:STE24 endopeptidase